MRTKDLHILPKFRDGWSYLYLEHCKIEQEARAIAVWDARGKVPVPCASLALLLLGPGTSITHAAVAALADNGCLVYWVGEGGVRFYSHGNGLTRSADNLLHQARLWADPALRLQVVLRLYHMRFPEPLPDNLTLQQIRGNEGVRVREAYAQASRETGVPWQGRAYRRDAWDTADPVNRALSAGNSCLYGICQAGIQALGLSPALGFIHTGKMLSFVYDVADLYKTRVSIPIAFGETARGEEKLETRVRQACRDAFNEQSLLKRIILDLEFVLDFKNKAGIAPGADFDGDAARPGDLWDPEAGRLTGGQNFGEPESEEEDHGGPDS
ncbi:MAG: type I-E CRISPR-associated endonuclease Cas1e [Deltaproteobacteria bacterium]|nr:type I-E CRISPR-associated endonuclease Cas1e [Deltaproteobacteria bacterium]